ncbi:hypothetical protein PF008_g22326 [Phytophthora fragariae]|uniref:Reverse transcriptase domain-containing protein n=1 Tax=Phytophthora fragariae TaxID=53985 RepID=A0A6G0QTZ9_9STRA|nr:hypothetical protein PF008_g22326 [Phytophthora fragariae]
MAGGELVVTAAPLHSATRQFGGTIDDGDVPERRTKVTVEAEDSAAMERPIRTVRFEDKPTVIGMEEVLQHMATNTAAKDDRRAAIYVATVRPTQASAKYASESREAELRARGGPVVQAEARTVSDHQAGEGAVTPGTGEGAEAFETGEGEETREDVGGAEASRNRDGSGVRRPVMATNPPDHGDNLVTSRVPAGTVVVPTVPSVNGVKLTGGPAADVGEIFAPPTSTTDGGDEKKTQVSVAGSVEQDEIMEARLARHKARKAAKRRRIRALQLKRRREARATDAERRQAEDARRLQRCLEADEALAALQQRRDRSGGEPSTRASTTARVSLVKQQREQTSEMAETSAEYVGTEDGLPTAIMEVSGERRCVKLDSCARYSIAGTDWMSYDDKVEMEAPVEFAEGIGGFLLDVVGVWRFELRSVFNEKVVVDACVVAGCTSEFLLGVDFMRAKGAMMDFGKNEVRYREDGHAVVIPFRTREDSGGARVAAVRMTGKAQLAERTVTPVQVSVAAEDGECGIFIPTKQAGAVMLAATVTKEYHGRAWVPAVNTNGTVARLPNKKELGTWIPLDKEMDILAMNGELRIDRLGEWLNEMGDTATPLENEDEVQIGVEDTGSRNLVMKLLRVYRQLSRNSGDYPPATALDMHHHIDTGDVSPIMLKRRRQAQTEGNIIEDNVSQMLNAGVIEEGNGAWGFPVVLVRKKDGEVRFCVDCRALNKVTKTDVYHLPRIDENLEALGGALLFTTLDL